MRLHSNACHHIALAGIAVVATAFAAALPVSAQVTVYANDFTANANGFSTSARDTSPNGEVFLGRFVGTPTTSTTLSLAGLAPHTQVTLFYDLYAIFSIDGNGNLGGGPDTVSVTADGGTLLSTNFANYNGQNQNFGGPDGLGGYITGGPFPRGTGALAINSLGYVYDNSFGDSTYRFQFTFAHSAPTLDVTFTMTTTEQSIGDESFGLDNVRVDTNASVAAPEAGTCALAATAGLLPFVGLAVRRRRGRA